MTGRLFNPQHLHFPLLALSIGLLGYALATADWPCGNLFTQCFKTLPILIVIILLAAGVGGLGLIFLIDLFGACSSKWIPGPVCTTIKLLILFVSASAVLTGNLLYTYWKLPYWSYTFSLIGSVTASQVVILAVINCRCLGSKL
ncbi:unnamed protein product [Trichobilharzia szidati]|uniref:Uncharacterized protein n=1 Tax=Trichobilharzia regenti TaxID=157069 RepID=A0A183VQN8_TRIRE|nr:unnamed protein product [Trichobilharzia szidati]CAH8875044.1 unnamed protein product [Trichobilharzia regenti]VDP98673.1 unnamed protein product [Trichobilharzia regenti]